jgi:hypothetical protein
VLATVEMGSQLWQRLTEDARFPYVISDGEMGVRVDVPGAPFVLYLTHALNPFHDPSSFSDQRTFVRDIVRAAAAEQRPVVIVGDFNMSDRSENYRLMYTAFVDAMREGDVPTSTYFGGFWPLLLVRIDHAFVSRGWCADDGSTSPSPAPTIAGSKSRSARAPEASISSDRLSRTAPRRGPRRRDGSPEVGADRTTAGRTHTTGCTRS